MTTTVTPSTAMPGLQPPAADPLANKAQAWSALFSEPMSALVQRYTASVGFDQRLWQADIAGSLAHAEMLALTMAESVVGDWRLTDCTLYVTKEPCPMCAGAVVHCRLNRVVFGAPDPKGGAAGSAVNLLQFPTLNHRCEISGGVRGEDCAGLLRSFFAERRAEKS